MGAVACLVVLLTSGFFVPNSFASSPTHLFVAGGICDPYDWATGPNIWVADSGVKVLQFNNMTTNAPQIVYQQYGGWVPPSTYPANNSAWNACASTILLEAAGNETVSFQVMVSAAPTTTTTNVSLNVSSLYGPGGAWLASDTWENSSVVKEYLEAYIPVNSGSAPNNYPDPLVPFYDPYNASHESLVGRYSVQAGTTQAVWVDLNLPSHPVPGEYNGTVSVSATGIPTWQASLRLIVFNGTLPAFDSSQTQLKTWGEMYNTRFWIGERINSNAMFDQYFQEYQRMGHQFDIDLSFDDYLPQENINYTSNNISINWSAYDALYGPSLSGHYPNGTSFFGDGTTMRVLNSPITEAWTPSGYGWSINTNTTPPPGMMNLLTNYSYQISSHAQAMGWNRTEILGYVFDEPEDKVGNISNCGHSYCAYILFHDIELYFQAINKGNIENQWQNPVRPFLTGPPSCLPGVSWDPSSPNDSGANCVDHHGLSYPNNISDSWVLDWSPGSPMYIPGPVAGPYGVYNQSYSPNGTNYQYTVNAVAANSTAPVPIEKWTYQSGPPFEGGIWLGTPGTGPREWSWGAEKYNLTGYWIWAVDFWPDVSGCSNGAYSAATGNQGADGILFYPGNQLDCINYPNEDGMGGIAGPLPSIRLEEWRRGYQDSLYMWLLQQQDRKTGQDLLTPIINGLTGANQSGSWGALDWQGYDPYWYMPGNAPGGNTCTDAANPNGPTGSWNCAGEWTNNPAVWHDARLALACAIGFYTCGELVLTYFSATPAMIILGQSTTFSVGLFSPENNATYSYSGLPKGCAPSNVSSLVCTPQVTGSFVIKVVVTDSSGGHGQASTSLVVKPPPLTVKAFVANPPSVTLGQSTNLSITATGGDTTNYTYT
ncbi:MAG: DUF4091 domain-containing protein, partial [Nitrososphaerota archaeon]|nr:DUF4091 domain-containing protein [Nitrososphaerota archaeon]